MESSQSKRSSAFSQEMSQPLSEKDMEELQSTLPPDKKLKAGQEYIWNRKSKRKAEYWKHYLEYVENGKLRAESNKGLGEIASMYDMLNSWEQSEDLNFQAMAIAMKKKFDKYRGNVDKMNKFIYVALLLDPHSKLVIVELALIDMHGKEKGMKLANDVKEFICTLFEEYRKMYASNIPQSTQSGDNLAMDVDNSRRVRFDDYMKNLKEKAKRMKGTSGYAISELDRF
uniref:hAT-like transposase RNase-H fold domain-containing protein n=1 Tax=Chenopodium quinoa TaxID=63459 RepID=A0A803N208_CHEQI